MTAMNQKLTKQSPKITLGYFLTLFLVFVFLLTPTVTQAETKAELDALFQQAFGKSTKKTSSAGLISQKLASKKQPQKNNSTNRSSADDLAALYAQAFGKKKNITAPSNVSVELRVNKAIVGDITVFSNQQGEMDRAETSPLLDSLQDVLKEHIFKRIKKQISAKKHVSFRTLTKLGMKTTYNSVNLSLDLQINPALRKPRVLSMKSKKRASVRAENKISAEEISAFLNMYSNVGFNSNSDKANLKMKLEGSLAIRNAVLETTVDLRNKRWDVGRTTLTYDKPDKLQRFVVGNISTGNRNFQENLELIGLRASKEFFMKPELQIRPKANQSFILETESEVEVYINNHLRQRYYLQEGIYSLEDIGLYNGANNIRVKITDAFGKVMVKTSEQYYDSHLLKPKLSLYSFSVGYLSNKQAHIKSDLKRKPILSAYYEKGLTKNLTMSIDAQISPNSYLLGAEAITSIPKGSLKHSFAVSGGSNKHTGFATRFEFKPNVHRELISLDTLRADMLSLDTKVGRFLNSWSVSGEYRSKDFSMINQVDGITKDTRKLKAQLQTQFSLDLSNNWHGNLNLGVADYYDSDKSVSANLSAIKRFNNGVRLSVGANYDSRDDFSMNLQISIPLDRENRRSRKSLELLANSKDKSIASKLSLRSTSLIGRNSLAGSVEYIHNAQFDKQKLDLRYRNAKFETQFNARNIRNLNSNGKDSQQLSIGFNSSIACVGKRCAPSYPIDDSFALVMGPSNQNKPIAINNGYGSFTYTNNISEGLPDNYIAVIPGKGRAAVVPLESYRFQNINIDESTMPDGYDSEKTEFEVFPRYHQGFLVKAGGEPATIIDGMLVDDEKKPLGFKGGQWVPMASEGKTIAFFSNKIGRFRIGSIPAGKYKLELFDYPDMEPINISVPDKKGKVHNVGSLIIIE